MCVLPIQAIIADKGGNSYYPDTRVVLLYIYGQVRRYRSVNIYR